MATLHTVNKSPFDRPSLQSCLGHCLPGDSVLLIEDGVLGARKGAAASAALAAAMPSCKIYVLGPDAVARGMAPDTFVPGVETVDYSGFVDLAAGHDRVQSWL